MNNSRIRTRLDVSVASSDGSLLTTPLSLVVNTATESLYNDVYEMAANKPITFYQPSTSTEDKRIPYGVKTEAMSSLSFQQRRHILASRIARHIKSISHVSALVASNLPTSGTESSTSVVSSKPNIYTMAQIPPENELSQVTQLASKALEHVRTSWASADIAQDALYFHHDSLWKMRAHPHDILGAMDVYLKGRWGDMSRDARLEDKYLDSQERSYTKTELQERFRSAVRRKLVLGEIGYHEQKHEEKKTNFRWNVALEQDGTVVHLHHGEPRMEGAQKVYPMEAKVTVLSEADPASWTLLSIRVRTNVKAGDSMNKLDLTQDQMFRFHKLCERAMAKEENRVSLLRNNFENKEVSDERINTSEYIARPLEKIFVMSHIFSLSWQMEVLSSQAESLRKGAWSGTHSLSGNVGEAGIEVSTVHFYSEEEQFDKENPSRRIRPLAYMAIHFWEIDGRTGSPKLGHLTTDKDEIISSKDGIYSVKNTDDWGFVQSRNRLRLEIRAIPLRGLEVSLSSGESIKKLLLDESDGETRKKYLQEKVTTLLSSLQNPFELSASHALLAAAVICAERRSFSVWQALENTRAAISSGHRLLPRWIQLSVEGGSISVSAHIEYDGLLDECSDRSPVVLFRLTCDSRTGRYVPTFPRATTLLRLLACNDSKASDIQSLRPSKMSDINSESKRSTTIHKELTGRIVKEAFSKLQRSLDTLARRVGVGGEWDDLDPATSPALRQKSILQACDDVCVALLPCAGMCSIYGLGSIALSIAGGTATLPDIAGGPIEPLPGLQFLNTPPISIVLNQHIREEEVILVNGEKVTKMFLDRELCSITATTTDSALTLHLFHIRTQSDSAALRKFVACRISPDD